LILTDRFVYVHQPKTGGTFVTKVLERLLKPDSPRSVLGRLARRLGGSRWKDTNKHGLGCEIPDSHAGLPVVATARHPLDRYVSQYEFAWWKDHPREWFEMDAIRERFPHFPDLSFEEFADAASTGFHKMKHSPLKGDDALGFHSEQFVRYYFRDPEEAWGRIDNDYIAARGWEKDMLPVTFLHMEDLNRELHDFLLGHELPEDDLAFILEQGKILPEGSRRRDDQVWSRYYTPELEATLRHRERLLFAIQSEYSA
jgi:hypothetical protein